MNTTPAILALADGSIFQGISIGAPGSTTGEVVFNTAMTGYQEILTDPSYSRQIVTLTYPHIGNVGVNAEDDESGKIQAAGLVIRDLPLLHSNWRAERSLADYLQAEGVVGIAEIDTRRLTRILREKGAQNGCIIAGQDAQAEAAVQQAQAFAGLKGMDLAKEVSTQTSQAWDGGLWSLGSGYSKPAGKAKFKVVAYDFGVKHNILRLLVDRGCEVTVVPAQTPAEEALASNPDGLFISNGPGDPQPCDYAIAATKVFLEQKKPVFGICLGMQILALACGAQTSKMKFGHHGANHPVHDLASNSVSITSQNHGFSVDEASLPQHVEATHRSLFDGSLQGIRLTDRPAFAFQGHPEASPGPHDIRYLFDRFVELMERN